MSQTTALVIPELEGRFDGYSLRVPTPTVSVVDFTAILEKETDTKTLRALLKEAAGGELAGILQYSEEPLVSTDIIGENHSSIVDLELISQVAPNFFRVVSWYDNENSYSVRCVDLLAWMVSKDNA